MPTLYIQTDWALVLDRFQLALSGTFINDAAFTVDVGIASQGGPITGVAAGTPHVVTSAAHGLTNGSTVILTQVQGVTGATGVCTVANVTTNTFELAGSAGTGTFATDGTPYWYAAVPGATGLALVYQTGTNGQYVALGSGSLPFANGVSYVAIVDGVGFNFHREFRFTGQVWR